MTRPISEKCRCCAELPEELAKEKNCREGPKCHVRQSKCQKQDLRNGKRHKQYRSNQGASSTNADVTSAVDEKITTPIISVPIPESYAAIVHL